MSLSSNGLERWMYDPTIGKIVAACLAVVVARLLAGLLGRGLLHRVKDTTSRYRLRKLLAFGGSASLERDRLR